MGFFLINYWQQNNDQYYDVIGRFDDLIKLVALDIVCKWTLIGRLGNANYILSIAYEVNDFCGLWILPRATSFIQASNSGATGWYMDTLITLIHSNLYNRKMTKHKKRAYWTVTLNMCVRTIMKTHGRGNYLPISVYYMPIDRLWCECNHRKTRNTQGAYNLIYCFKRKIQSCSLSFVYTSVLFAPPCWH